jgi:hypothetical protein
MCATRSTPVVHCGRRRGGVWCSRACLCMRRPGRPRRCCSGWPRGAAALQHMQRQTQPACLPRVALQACAPLLSPRACIVVVCWCAARACVCVLPCVGVFKLKLVLLPLSVTAAIARHNNRTRGVVGGAVARLLQSGVYVCCVHACNSTSGLALAHMSAHERAEMYAGWASKSEHYHAHAHARKQRERNSERKRQVARTAQAENTRLVPGGGPYPLAALPTPGLGSTLLTPPCPAPPHAQPHPHWCQQCARTCTRTHSCMSSPAGSSTVPCCRQRHRVRVTRLTTGRTPHEP